MIELLTKKDLTEPPKIIDDRNVGGYNLTVTFIKRHTLDMGGRGKPLRFDRAIVESFLQQYFRSEAQTQMLERMEEERLLEESKRFTDGLIKQGLFPVQTGPREMRGRGGKVREGEAA